MPYKEKEVKQIYWNITDAARIFNVDPSLIAYWERKFHLNFVRAHNSWAVKIDAEKMQRLREIYYLIKVEMYSTKGALRKLENQ